MLLVVSDTSPLRALDHLGVVGILEAIFGQVLIPPAVDHELKNPSSHFRAVDIARFNFIEVRPPQDSLAVDDLCHRDALDRGEAEALVLAREVNASTVLIDERCGRSAAKKAGLQVIGTLGILLAAKKRSLLPLVRPLVDDIEKNLGFFISDKLRERILREAGETP